MNAGKIIKFIFYTSILILVLKGGYVMYHKLSFNEHEEQSGIVRKYKPDFKEIKIPELETNSKVNNGFDFIKMLNLIEACEKVNYLDYLRFTRPKEVTSINSETLETLKKGLHEEKSKLKNYIRKIKSTTKSGIPSKRMNALKYYHRVLELKLQEIAESSN